MTNGRTTSALRPVPHIVTELPGPRAREHIAFDERFTSPSLPRAYPIVPVRGEGVVIEDLDGNRFLDFCAGIAVNVTGHCHPRVVAAIERQASQLLHYTASDFYLPIYAHLAAELERIAPMSADARVFLTAGEDVIRTSPPLCVDAHEVEVGLRLIGEAVAEVAAASPADA